MNARKVLVILGAAASWLLAACAPASLPQATPTAPPAMALNATHWSLEKVAGQAALPDTQVTLNFENGTLNGTDGCNQYSSTYTVAGNKITISPEIAMTMMACADPIMQQGAAYINALTQTVSYQATAERLTLLDAAGKALATFTPQSQTLSPMEWLVTSYNNGQQAVVSVSAGATLTLNFSPAGQLSGTAGCNNYNATYEVSGPSLKIGPIASTKKMCAEPAGVMEQEAQFLLALQTATTYRREGNQLELRTADGALAVTAVPLPATTGDVTTLAKDPQNAVYIIEGETIALVDGMAEKEVAPGASAKQVTRYFGNAVELDLNGDGQPDTAFLLVQDNGGSGTFYYVAAALKTAEGYVGTNALFLGDRIAPQSTAVDPNNPTQFVVSYGTVPADAPMSAEPTQMMSKTFKVEAGALVEVVTTTP